MKRKVENVLDVNRTCDRSVSYSAALLRKTIFYSREGKDFTPR